MNVRKLYSENMAAFDDVIRMTPLRRLAIFLIALGEFVDGYDLLVMSGALIFLKPQFHMSASEVGLLGAAAFFGAAIGLLVAGSLTDRLGRRAVFTFNLLFFVVFAILSALVTNTVELFVIRILIGLAIGADIAASMTFLAEISPRMKRGALSGALPQISWTFGALTSLIVALILYKTAGEQAWRWMFGLSAIPALLVVVGRKFLPESPRWLIKRGKFQEAKEALERLGVSGLTALSEESSSSLLPVEKRSSYLDLFKAPYTRQAIFAFIIVGFTPMTGGIASVVGPYVFRYVGAFGAAGSLEAATLTWIGGLVGSIIAFLTIDRIGRVKSVFISTVGSFLIALVLAFGAVKHPTIFLIAFFILGMLTWFGASSFWVLPSELLPTNLRGRAQGFGNGLSRLMVAVTTFLVPVGIAHVGFTLTMISSGMVGLIIGLYSLTGLRFEPRNRVLEEVSVDE